MTLPKSALLESLIPPPSDKFTKDLEILQNKYPEYREVLSNHKKLRLHSANKLNNEISYKCEIANRLGEGVFDSPNKNDYKKCFVYFMEDFYKQATNELINNRNIEKIINIIVDVRRTFKRHYFYEKTRNIDKKRIYSTDIYKWQISYIKRLNNNAKNAPVGSVKNIDIKKTEINWHLNHFRGLCEFIRKASMYFCCVFNDSVESYLMLNWCARLNEKCNLMEEPINVYQKHINEGNLLNDNEMHNKLFKELKRIFENLLNEFKKGKDSYLGVNEKLFYKKIAKFNEQINFGYVSGFFLNSFPNLNNVKGQFIQVFYDIKEYVKLLPIYDQSNNKDIMKDFEDNKYPSIKIIQHDDKLSKENIINKSTILLNNGIKNIILNNQQNLSNDELKTIKFFLEKHNTNFVKNMKMMYTTLHSYMTNVTVDDEGKMIVSKWPFIDKEYIFGKYLYFIDEFQRFFDKNYTYETKSPSFGSKEDTILHHCCIFTLNLYSVLSGEIVKYLEYCGYLQSNNNKVEKFEMILLNLRSLINGVNNGKLGYVFYPGPEYFSNNFINLNSKTRNNDDLFLEPLGLLESDKGIKNKNIYCSFVNKIREATNQKFGGYTGGGLMNKLKKIKDKPYQLSNDEFILIKKRINELNNYLRYSVCLVKDLHKKCPHMQYGIKCPPGTLDKDCGNPIMKMCLLPENILLNGKINNTPTGENIINPPLPPIPNQPKFNQKPLPALPMANPSASLPPPLIKAPQSSLSAKTITVGGFLASRVSLPLIIAIVVVFLLLILFFYKNEKNDKNETISQINPQNTPLDGQSDPTNIKKNYETCIYDKAIPMAC